MWEIGDHKTDDIYTGKILLVEFPEYVLHPCHNII